MAAGKKARVAEAALARGAEAHRAGRFEDAARSYAEALRADPENVDARVLLGGVTLRLGRAADAVAVLDGAVERDPTHALGHLNRGRALFALDRLEEAESAFSAACSTRPGFVEAHLGLSLVRLARGDVDGAAAALSEAARLDPALPGLAQRRAALARTAGLLRLSQGHPDAVPWLRAALHALPEDAEVRLALADALHADAAPPADIGPELLHLYASEGIDHQRIERATRRVLERIPVVSAALAGGPVTPAALALSVHPLFAPWLSLTIVTHPRWHTLLRGVRRWLLEERGDPAAMAAVAKQAWNTEYAAAVSAAETALLERVREPSVRAMYEPVEDGRDEAPEIPSLGAPVDATSQVVARQYEDNPYPRLVGLHRRVPRSFAAYVAGALGRAVPVPDGPLRVLVAGGGTGQHPIGVATTLADAEVVCVDLSRASLARARRLAADVSNLRFVHGDLLDLGRMDGPPFGFVDCVGVLHHLADPVAGGRALVSRLAPHGLLRLGLYSERGRSEIVAARALATEHGWMPTTEGLREAREFLLALPDDHPAARVTASVDFYSQSGLRDLVFHPCEHRYSPTQVGELVRTLGLELVGVQALPAARRLFAERWSDGELTDLARWEELEVDHPRIFSGMIHVWCRQPLS